MMFLQSFLYSENICMQILAAKLEEMGKRERGVGEIQAA
jgi:hypothetical protein